MDVIPIMYDYNCEKGMCMNTYNNLNDKGSFDLSKILKKEVIKIFSILKNMNSAGFGLSKDGKLMKFNLGQKYQVKGVLCSTNFDPKDQTDYEKIKCEDTY